MFFISYRRTYVEVYSSALLSFELCNWSYVFFLLLFSSLSPRCMNDKASAEENDFSSESCWFRACSPFNVCTVLSCQLVCISNWQVLLLIIFHNHPTAVLVNPFGRIVWLDCPYQEYVELFSCVLKVIIVFFLPCRLALNVKPSVEMEISPFSMFITLRMQKQRRGSQSWPYQTVRKQSACLE